MSRFFSWRPVPMWFFGLPAVMVLSFSLPLRAETLRGPGGLPPGLVAAMLGRMKGEALDPRGCARLGDLRGCFGAGGARFRGAGEDLGLRAVAWGREGRLQKLRWRSVGKDGSREVYRGRGIEAWWRVVPLGYEEGFELLRRPQGRGPVEVELKANRVGRKVGEVLRWGGVRYGKLWVTDARGRRVPAVLRDEGRRIWIRIEGRGWQYPLRIDPLVWVEQAASLPTGLAKDSEFGYSVALSGNGEVAVVGAPNVNSNAGAAYVYTYDSGTGTWSSPVALAVPSGADLFGNSVALSVNGGVETALVGAYGTSGGGAAYIYTNSGGGWSSPVTLSFPTGAIYFGSSVALSDDGNEAIVGAYGTNNFEGAAYIYTNSGAGWSAPVTLTVPSVASDFGSSVALSGDGEEAIVGAPNTTNTNSSVGAAYIYTNSGAGWSSTPVTLSVPSGAGGLGWSVALSDNGGVETALVGAPFTNSNAGAAYVYACTSSCTTSSGWNGTPVTLSVPSGAGDLGYSVALSDNGGAETALVGAPGTNSNVGAAYVYACTSSCTTSSGWNGTPVTLSVPSGAGGLGWSVALSDNGGVETALVGASYTNSSVGAAYFYGAADLDLVLDAPSAEAPGGQYTEQAVLTNDSSYASFDLALSLPIPAGTTYQDFSVTSSMQGSCTASPSSGTVSAVSCDVGPLLANGGTGTASVTLNVPSNAPVGTVITGTASEAAATPALSAQATTTVEVPPTISGFKDETVTVGAAVPSESFTIGGTGTLTVTASSSNTTLLPDTGIGGYTGCTAAGSCTLTLSPVSGQVGTTAVTVTVENGYGQETSASFALTVNPPGAPTISGLTDETVAVGQTVPTESFTIGGTGTLTVTASSSNTTLLPDTGIGGYAGCAAAGTCSLTLVPASGQVGTAIVTVTVANEYGQESSADFLLTVQSSVPAVSGLEDISTAVGSPAVVENFTVSGVGPLSVKTETTNEALLPEAFIEVSPGCGSGSGEVVDRCTLTLTPTVGMTGEAGVLVTVTDAEGQTGTGLMTLYVEPSLGSTSSGVSGGGGSVGVGMLVGLLALAGLRRRDLRGERV